MNQRVSEQHPVTVDPTTSGIPGDIGVRVDTTLDGDGADDSPRDAVQTDDGGIAICGAADGGPVVIRLDAMGQVVWRTVVKVDESASSFTSLVETLEGELVAVGWTGSAGLIVRFDFGGSVRSKEVIHPTREKIRIYLWTVKNLDGERTLAVGSRWGHSGDIPNSILLVANGASGATDWVRVYGRNMSSVVGDAVVISPHFYLINAWKSTKVGLRDYQVTVAIRDGLQRWEHPYPDSRPTSDTVGLGGTDDYYFSATQVAAAGDDSDSTALVARRALGGDLSWIRTVSFPNQSLVGGFSLASDAGIHLVCDAHEAPPVVARVGWDGSVRGGGSLIDTPVWRLFDIDDQTVLHITEDGRLRTLVLGGDE